MLTKSPSLALRHTRSLARSPPPASSFAPSPAACSQRSEAGGHVQAGGGAVAAPVPSSSLQTMVDNLKAEVYEARLRLMSRATHREEELCEGDIRGSFAERA